MTTLFGRDDCLRMEDSLDYRKDLYIQMYFCSDVAETWLNRGQALDLIAHLQDVFDIGREEIL